MSEEEQLVKVYDKGGQSAVYDYATDHRPEWPWSACEPCEDITPTWDGVCAVCFTVKRG